MTQSLLGKVQMTTVKSIGDSWRDSGQPEKRRPGAWLTSTSSCIFPKHVMMTDNRTYTQGIPRVGEHEIHDRTDITIPTPYFDQRISRMTCDCGKQCKNLRGIRIHQAKIKCMDKNGQMLRTGLIPGETKEVHGQDSHHSTQSILAIDQTIPCRLNYKQIKWPSAKETVSEWLQFDEDVSEIIRTTSKGNADRWLNILSTIIVSYTKEKLGLYEGEKEKTYRKNLGANKIQDLRRELRALKKKYRQVNEGEIASH